MKAKFGNIAIMCFMVLLLVSIANANYDTSERGGEQEVICATCASMEYNITVNIGEIEDVLPEQEEICIPVTVTSLGNDLSDFELNIQYQSGIILDSISVNHSDWSTDPDDIYYDDIGDNPINIQFATDPALHIDGDYETYTLFEFWFSVDDGFEFDETILIEHTGAYYPRVDILSDNPDRGFCQATANNGYIRTIDGEASIMIGTPTCYSFQGQDVVNDPAKDTLIHVPVYFKANFPSDYLKVGFIFTGIYMGDWVSFEAAPGTDLYFMVSSAYGYLRDQTTHYEASEDWILLGELLFEGHNYYGDYTSTLGFSTTDIITNANINANCKVQCEGSDIYVPFEELNFTDGGFYYPEYTCETTLGNAIADISGEVDIYATVNHSFWAQNYKYSINLDEAILNITNSTKLGVNSPDVGIYYHQNGNYDIFAAGSLRGKYILPGSSDIFKLTLDVDEDFINDPFASTSVNFDCLDVTDCWVNDFFSADTNKIIRDCEDGVGYFDLTGCTVTSPQPVLVAENIIAFEDGGNYYAEVPVNIDWIHSANNFDKIVFEVESNWTYDSTTTDYGYDDISWQILLAIGRNRFTGVISNAGSVNYPDQLIHIWFSHNGMPIGNGSVHIEDGYFMETSVGNRTREFSDSYSNIYLPAPKLTNDEERPFTYNLNSNYPNPFNATTNIMFEIVETEMVTLDIYNILGRKVNTLVNEEMNAGNHQVTWNGKNSSGNNVSTGYYFYKITTPNYSQARKMLLLK